MMRWIRHPAAVGVLVLVALGLMARNVVSPFLRSGAEEAVESFVPEDEETVFVEMNPYEPKSDSVVKGRIERIQWKRLANRNPFVLENRRGPVARWLMAQNDSSERKRSSPIVKHGGTWEPRLIVRNNGLKAVVLGPHRELALIHDTIVSVGSAIAGGIVERITRDTVWIRPDSASSAAWIFGKSGSSRKSEGGVYE